MQATREIRFKQRGALLKEPVEADSRHRNDILAEDTIFTVKSDRLLGDFSLEKRPETRILMHLGA